ncbi:MAG TPA: DUF3592 domain-containing protein [Stellaceae bacterium]|nr:DUF3592 domain-containing protein [Stellaceae bacterium]
MLAVLAAAALSTAALMTGMAYANARKQQILKTRGVTTEGRVVNLHMSYGKRTYYYVDYRFTPLLSPGAEPSTREIDELVGEADYGMLRIGDAVPVIYDPVDLDRSALNFRDRVHKGDPFAIMPFILWSEFFVIGISCGIPLILSFRRYYKEKNLVRWGCAAPATITGEKETGVGRRRALRVTYTFTDAHGRTVQGVCKGFASRNDAREKFSQFRSAIGDSPTALYDPRNSTRSLLYPPTYVVCLPPHKGDQLRGA